MPPEMFDKLFTLPNIRDYQCVDLRLKDGRILEEVSFVDGALQDLRIAEYLPDVVDVVVNGGWSKTYQDLAQMPLKWGKSE